MCNRLSENNSNQEHLENAHSAPRSLRLKLLCADTVAVTFQQKQYKSARLLLSHLRR